MTKQNSNDILLNLVDETFETQSRLLLFSDYIQRLSDELGKITTTTPQKKVIKLLDLAVSELIGELNALDDEIERAEEARKAVNGDD
ncbi:hypothetical protein [Fructobacillus parabroussonetiae]|uniref:Phage protein n=1 Tax=Fructobacillus parabroussonetiae TaxID=2713174 RepID=A0ABS5QVI9_9LACO|nr:hypothetical protein [Fructobacillus parabroussonetiae]MBS9337213.1 hypothetical protein [Fructobacillus parabroussonetiae]